MVYAANGQAVGNRTRSPWSLAFLVNMFWGAVEFIGLYFQTLIQPDLTNDKVPRGRSPFSDGRDPPGPPGGRRRMGRITHEGGPNAPPAGG